MAPKTIQEFIELCAEKQLDTRRMRFFIGEDCREAKCFGVYYDEARGRYVVYKNKADGSRAVRYDGPDEAEACRILYEKMADEIQLRRDKRAAQKTAVTKKSQAQKRRERIISIITVVVILAVAAWIIVDEWNKPSRGYYHYDDTVYYYLDDGWYYYDDYYGGWYETYDLPSEDMSGYWYGETDNQFYDGYAFEDTDAYRDWEDARDSSSWSSSDSSSWSSSDTNWDSDW